MDEGKRLTKALYDLKRASEEKGKKMIDEKKKNLMKEVA